MLHDFARNYQLIMPKPLPVGMSRRKGKHCLYLCSVGFDAHGGGSHPVIEGIVICQEYEQTLRDAVEQQKQITLEKELKKKEERVYKNWRKLIRGLIIKENLAKKYADDEIDGKELATDAKYQWPVLPKDQDDNEENSM